MCGRFSGALLAVIALVWSLAGGQPAVCPPPDFDAVRGLDVAKFATAPWFSQAQAGLKVFFYANKGRVNGPAVSTGPNSTDVELIGNITDLEEPSKFAVLPAILQNVLSRTNLRFFFPDHWVVAVGPSRNATLAYDWAIVSAGPPRTPGIEGCRTDVAFLGLFEVHQGGLWLLTREPVDKTSDDIMRNVAEALGFDLSVLVDVKQAKCKYKGAP